MRRSRNERGEGRFGCVVGLLILLATVYVAYKVIPVKIRSAELRQVIVDEAKSAGTHNNKKIRAAIMHKAKELDLPLTDANLTVERVSSEIRIEAKYTVPVEFISYTYQWNFRHRAQNPIF